MNRRLKILSRLTLATAFVLLLASPGTLRAQMWGQYGVDVLPLPVGDYNFHVGRIVNDAGQVAGSIFNGSYYEAFLFDGGMVRRLGTLGGRYSVANGINNLGQVTGYSEDALGREVAFLSNGPGTAMQGLGTLGGPRSRAWAINNTGQVTGSSVNALGRQEAFLSNGPGSPMLGLGAGAPEDEWSFGYSINDAGQVTGSNLDRELGNGVAFVSDGPGTPMHGLGTLEGNFSEGYAINNLGQVTGVSRAADGRNEAFLSSGPGTALERLGTMGSDFSEGLGISDSGQVIGRTGSRAALWEGGVGFFLDAIVGRGWTFSSAHGMSGNGTVLAFGFNPEVNGGASTWAVLRQQGSTGTPTLPPATVTPEPGTWLLLATGLLGIAVTYRRRPGKSA